MKPHYTRASPSPRYRRLVQQYELMHAEGEVHLGIPPEATFTGQSLPPQAPHIKRLIKRTGARTLLDRRGPFFQILHFGRQRAIAHLELLVLRALSVDLFAKPRHLARSALAEPKAVLQQQQEGQESCGEELHRQQLIPGSGTGNASTPA